MTNPTANVELKQCTHKEKCVHPEAVNGGWLPADEQHFPKKKGRDKLEKECRGCASARTRQWGIDHPEQRRDNHRRDRAKNRERYRLAEKKRRQEKIEQFGVIQRQYTQAQKLATIARVKRWKANNPEKVRVGNKKYRADHHEECRSRERRWASANPESFRIRKQRRRARERSLPDDFVQSDWQNALDYFNHCCAVCGRQLRDLFGTHTAAGDHWIPLASPKCPGTIPTNIVPLCHGESGCNNRKHDRDPVEFLESEFGKRDAQKILKRINTFFQSVRGYRS